MSATASKAFSPEGGVSTAPSREPLTLKLLLRDPLRSATLLPRPLSDMPRLWTELLCDKERSTGGGSSPATVHDALASVVRST